MAIIQMVAQLHDALQHLPAVTHVTLDHLGHAAQLGQGHEGHVILVDDITADQFKEKLKNVQQETQVGCCLLYTSPSPRDRQKSRMPSSA